MFGYRLGWMFRNRWLALLWAGGICWLAVSAVAPAEPSEANRTAEALDILQIDIAELRNELSD